MGGISLQTDAEQKRDSLLTRCKPWIIDGGTVVAVIAFSLVQLQLTTSYYLIVDEGYRTLAGYVQPGLDVGTVALLFLCALPLLLRRVFPLAIWAMCLLLYLVTQLAHNDHLISVAAPMVALYTIATMRPRRVALAVLGISCVVLVFVPLFASSPLLSVLVRVQNVALLVAATALGDAMRARQDSIAVIRKRAEEAERAQEEFAMRLVADERLRIAREVHDITAHSLSAVALQAAVAERLLASNPSAAREAIAHVRLTSKESLDELRAIIGVLREPTAAETTPTATTLRLEEVATYLRQAGVETSINTAAYQRENVPVFIDVALFGIAREAATNIVKHAAATHASFTLTSTDDEVHLSIRDDGLGAMAISHAQTGGHGIMGMRERAVALGGSFEARSLGAARPRVPAKQGFDGKTIDDMAFGDEPFNATALGVLPKDESVQQTVGEKTGFLIDVSIPLQPKGGSL
ncbi:MAG: histidine kinase [Coriobacteriales bacterium]|jgi:signal transduction histidine kinase|nr:histidine kinase [Coriobacteriales bacterium]